MTDAARLPKTGASATATIATKGSKPDGGATSQPAKRADHKPSVDPKVTATSTTQAGEGSRRVGEKPRVVSVTQGHDGPQGDAGSGSSVHARHEDDRAAVHQSSHAQAEAQSVRFSERPIWGGDVKPPGQESRAAVQSAANAATSVREAIGKFTGILFGPPATDTSTQPSGGQIEDTVVPNPHSRTTVGDTGSATPSGPGIRIDNTSPGDGSDGGIRWQWGT